MATLKFQKERLRLYQDTIYDVQRYVRSSTAVQGISTQSHFRSRLTFDYHRLEKGLSMPARRLGFGREVVRAVIIGENEYTKRFGNNDLAVAVDGVLREYNINARDPDIEMPDLDRYLINERSNPNDVFEVGGSVEVTSDTLFAVETDVATQFLTSRRSVRHFSGVKIPRDDLLEVVSIARRCPSVCNRQAGHVFIANETDTMTRVLAHQNGNRGFGHLLGAVMIVTADMEQFHSAAERNQPFVDGGIFAMSIILSLHAKKLGGCMLNWSASAKADRALRAEFGIGDHQAVITMIGAGYPEFPIRVAASPRMPVAAVVDWV